MKLSLIVTVASLALGSPALLTAQGRVKEVPASARPPAGMCRIWLDDVPAAQQSAPTDCASAVRNRPAKGRVIFGDDYVVPRRGDSTALRNPAIQGFAPSGKKRPPITFP